MKFHGTGSEADQPFEPPHSEHDQLHDHEQARAIREIIRALRSVAFGSVEIVIQNSRIVQIERKEKFRLDRS